MFEGGGIVNPWLYKDQDVRVGAARPGMRALNADRPSNPEFAFSSPVQVNLFRYVTIVGPKRYKSITKRGGCRFFV